MPELQVGLILGLGTIVGAGGLVGLVMVSQETFSAAGNFTDLRNV